MGAFPVILALGMVLKLFSPLLAVAVCLPLLALHALALYTSENSAGTVIKVLGLSVVLPALMSGMFGPSLEMTNLRSTLPMLAGAVFVMTFVGSGTASGKSGTAIHSLLTRFQHAFVVTASVMAVNVALALLPPSLSFFRPMGWLMVACAYPLYYTWGNFRQRAAELEMQSKFKAGSQ